MARQEKTDADLFAVTTDGKKLKYMGDAIIARFTKMSDHIQAWAISASLHAALHKDFTEIPRVLKELSDRGFRSNALKLWFVHPDIGAPIRWVLKTTETPAHWEWDGDKAKTMADRYAADPDAFVALLMSKPYWEMSKETEFEGFSLPAKAAALLREATKILTDDKKKGHDKNNFKGLDALRKLVEDNGKKDKTTPSTPPPIVPVPDGEGSPALAETVH